jgi:hypothetical protein
MTIARAIESPADIPLAAGAVDSHVVPFEVRTLPEVPGATVCTALMCHYPRSTLVRCEGRCARTAVGDREGACNLRSQVDASQVYRQA